MLSVESTTQSSATKGAAAESAEAFLAGYPLVSGRVLELKWVLTLM